MDECVPWALEFQSRPLYTRGTTVRENENFEFITVIKSTLWHPATFKCFNLYTETTGTHKSISTPFTVWGGRGCNAMLLNQNSSQSLYITYF
jgi:hypothetical protein